MVTQVGLSGFFCGDAVEDGRSTGRSTVESGAATMKMISSTSITSMNGVTLISWVSPKSSASSTSLKRHAHRPLSGHSAARDAAIKVRDRGRRDSSRPLAREARPTSSR